MKNMTARLMVVGMVIALLLTAFVVPTAGMAQAATGRLDATGYVNTGRLNLRSGPHISYSSLAMIYKGQGFTMIGRNTPATWVQVRLPSGLVGWFNAYYIKTAFSIGALPVTGDAAVTVNVPPVQDVHLGLVVTGRLNVRSAPDPFSSVLTIVDMGTVLNLLGRNTSGTWAQVRTPSGVTGWVNAGYVRSNGVVKTLPITGP